MVNDTYLFVPTSAMKWHSAQFGYGASRSGAVGDERNSPDVVVPRQLASEHSAPPQPGSQMQRPDAVSHDPWSPQ